MNSKTVLNWVKEARAVEDFFSGGSGVLHVRGDAGTHSSHFGAAIDAAAVRAFGKNASIASIDPLNQAISTPLGILVAVCREFGFERTAPDIGGRAASSYSILSNLSAGGNLSISEVRVTLQPRSESEDLNSLTDSIAQILAQGADLSGKTVVFRQCHEIESQQRKILWASLWAPIFEAMLDHGAKFIFAYSPNRLVPIADSIPPTAHATIELPTYPEEDDVLADIVDYVERANLAPRGESAIGFARGVFHTCRTIQELYDRLALASLRGNSPS